MRSNRLAFVSFEPRDGQFEAFMSMEGILSTESDPHPTLQEAAALYQRSVWKMCCLVGDIQARRAARQLVPARRIWQLGDAIFELRDELARLSLQVNDVYGHLVRDLGVKRKWLEKVVIFRRYVPVMDAVPETLNWGRCEKGTRRIAERLSKGLPLSQS